MPKRMIDPGYPFAFLPPSFIFLLNKAQIEQSCHHGFEKEKQVGRVKCSKEPSQKEIKLSKAMPWMVKREREREREREILVSSSRAKLRSERRSKYKSGRVRTEELQRHKLVNL